MQRKALIATLALAAILLPLPAWAAGNVASVDLQSLIRDAPQVKASREILKTEYAPRLKAIKHAKDRIMALAKHFRELGPGTNELERASAMEQIKQARKELQGLTQQYQTGLKLRSTQLRASFKKLVEQSVATYAKAHGYTVVISDSVAYAGADTDITDAILAQLKSDYRQAQAQAKTGGGGP